MPLPNATYTLQGQPRPGEPMYSGPKHGMLLRLSAEAANALQSDPSGKPSVEFVVAEDGSSRIVIGDSSFSLQSQTEEIPHDLYLRSASAAKPFVPLKFYANVVGKLTISDRELDDELASRIHQKTADAKKMQSNRQTILLDANELPLPTAKGTKKKPDLFRKPLRAIDQPKPNVLAASTSSTPQTALPPRPSHAPKPSQDGMQKRLIHYLAVAERSTEDTLKAVGGSNCDPKAKQDILEAMNTVAVQVPASKGTQQIWRLKNESWLEVRPYEWPRLTETDRVNLGRGARRALQSLGIPESDPRWEHVKYRPPPANPTRTNSPAPSISVSTSAPTPLPKRGISSQDMRDKKTRKTDPKIMIKDETKPRPSSLPLSSSSSSKTDKISSTPANPALRNISPTSVRKPGSGYKLPSKPVELSQLENKSRDSVASSSSSTSKDADVIMKDGTRRPSDDLKLRPSISRVDPRVKREEGELSASSSGVGETDRPVQVKRIQHLKGEAGDSDRELDRGREKLKEKVREKREDGRERDRDRGRARDDKFAENRGRVKDDRSLERDNHSSSRDRESTHRHTDVSTMKRKKMKEEEEEFEDRAVEKRRKTEDTKEFLSAAGSSRDRDRNRERGERVERDRERDRDRGDRDRDRDRGRERGDRDRDRDKERERIRERADRDRDRERERQNRSERDPRPSKSGNEVTLDRKSSGHSLSISKGKIKKESSPLPLPPKKVKEPSPLPPPPRLSANASNSSRGSSNKGSKLRRKSPIYTSSEDDERRSPIPTPPTVSSSSSDSRHSRSYSSTTNDAPSNSSISLDTDRSSLRTKYSSKYVKYLGGLQTLLSQKNEIERRLARESSRSDSDGEVDLMEFDVLTKAYDENQRQWDELKSIMTAHGVE